MARDTSRDGGNRFQEMLLTHYAPLWRFFQKHPFIARRINRFLINSAIYKIPTRPYPFSLMTLDQHIPYTNRPKKTDTYTSWDSLIDRRYTGRHLPPDPEFNQSGKLPKLEDLACLFRKRPSGTVYSKKSTLLFPYWVQWFTDGFLRTNFADPTRLTNTTNHHIDLCNVYGLNPSATHKLREFQGGRLKSQMLNGEEYPLFYYENPHTGQVKPEFEGLYTPTEPEQEQPPERKATMFAMGSERGNIQIGYTMFTVLFLREHNRLCQLLAKEYPQWDDERLFQTARNILIVITLKIVLEEYINHISPYQFAFYVDPLAIGNQSWYRQNWMTVEFSLVYRWHSSLPDTLIYNGHDIPVTETLWNNELILNRGLGLSFAEICTQPAALIGLRNTADFLIESAELPSIQLGRQTQLASYNDYREFCSMPRVNSFGQITADQELQRDLARLYGHVDNLEFYVGLYAEDVDPNQTLAGVVGSFVGIDAFSQALTSPLLAPNIYNEKTFSPIGWKIVQSSQTLEDLVNRNCPQRSDKFEVSFYLADYKGRSKRVPQR